MESASLDRPSPATLASAPSHGGPSTPQVARPQAPVESPPAWWLVVLYPLLVLPVALGVAIFAPKAQGVRFLAALIGGELVLLLSALAWVRLSGLRLRHLLRLLRTSAAGLLLGVGVGLGCILAGGGVASLWRLALPASLPARFNVGRELATQGWSPWILFLAIALVPAFCEEVFFRGALQTALLRGRSPLRAVAVAAVVFAVAHLELVRLPDLLLGGLALSWLTWRTGSLWPSVLAHGLNNGASVLEIVLFGPSGLAGTDPTETLPAAAAAAMAATGLVALALVGAAARRWLPPAPDSASFLVPRLAVPPAATTAGAAPSPSGSDLP